jgi:two-component system cell cycle response regulator
MAATQSGTADLELPLERIRSHLALVANRDLYDPEHIEEVAALSVRIAALQGLGDAELADVEQVARLRDVGKAMVPIAVLRKQEPLDDSEWALLQRYPEHGALLVAGTPGWERLAASVRAGNERWDGAGYPDGLAGEEIPRASRITYVAQAYLAMRADRPYRAAVSEA